MRNFKSAAAAAWLAALAAGIYREIDVGDDPHRTFDADRNRAGSASG